MNPLFTAFVYLVWFLATYYVVFLLLVLVVGRDQLYVRKRLGSWRPRVTLLVPAYNEGAHIHLTIESLKRVTYPNAEFIILNDGSTDNTAKVVRAGIRGDKRFRFVDNERNKGKAATLNQGIALAGGEFVACMDADSMLDPDNFEKTLPYFRDPLMGAVTVSVEIAEKKRFLHKIIDLEYIIGLSLFLKVFSFIDSIFVTPGPFSVYRKSMLDEIGGFDIENMTEDLEIAYRIHRGGWRIANAMEARVRTICPPTFEDIYRQRRRWYTGAIQTLVQHKDMMFSRKYGLFGYVIPFNYALIFTGIGLFMYSLWLLVKNWGTFAWNLQYTGFNLLQQMQYLELDVLRLGSTNLIAISMWIMTFGLVGVGLYFTGKRFSGRKIGIAAYPLLFILYQVYWISALWNTVRRRRVAWR